MLRQHQQAVAEHDWAKANVVKAQLDQVMAQIDLNGVKLEPHHHQGSLRRHPRQWRPEPEDRLGGGSAIFCDQCDRNQCRLGHSMARLGDGTVVAWGKNLFGETNVPPGLNNVASISCGEDYELAMVGYGPPQIQMEPQTVTAHVGGGALLKADLAGTYPLTSQWYSNSIPVVGATNCWLLLTNAQLSDAGAYTLVVSNNVGQASSAAPFNAVDPSPYFLTPLPTQQNALVGTPFCLTISAAGTQPLAYQSQLNGVDLKDNGRISGTASPEFVF